MTVHETTGCPFYHVSSQKDAPAVAMCGCWCRVNAHYTRVNSTGQVVTSRLRAALVNILSHDHPVTHHTLFWRSRGTYECLRHAEERNSRMKWTRSAASHDERPEPFSHVHNEGSYKRQRSLDIKTSECSLDQGHRGREIIMWFSQYAKCGQNHRSHWNIIDWNVTEFGKFWLNKSGVILYTYMNLCLWIWKPRKTPSAYSLCLSLICDIVPSLFDRK